MEPGVDQARLLAPERGEDIERLRELLRSGWALAPSSL